MDPKELQEYYKKKFEIQKKVHHSRQKKVDECFICVRRTFFPNWDKRYKWIAVAANFSAPAGIYAFCDKINKVIWFRKIPQSEIIFLVFMLDEISHARGRGLKPKGHDREWVKNMRQAERIAKEKNFSDLAKEINLHIKMNKLFKKEDEEKTKRYLNEMSKNILTFSP